jgi:hypothetical protein
LDGLSKTFATEANELRTPFQRKLVHERAFLPTELVNVIAASKD